ncbi:ABC transporter permease [candidate division KSB1 bacterium]
MKHKPPKIAKWLLKSFLKKEDRAFRTEDFEEVFQREIKDRGIFRAYIWYWFQVIRTILEFINFSFYWRLTMFKNYLKTALRNIKRHKGFSIINILGLAIGMTCTILIFLWVYDEISTDKFHKNDNCLYQITSRVLISGEWQTWPGAPPAIGPAIKEEYPEIVNTARLNNIANNVLVTYKEKRFIEPIQAGDISLLEMFTFPLVKGSIETVKNDRYSIFITEKIAEKYFGDENPIGKVLLIDNSLNFTVKGVLKNIPDNSTIKFDFLVPLENLDNFYNRDGYTLTWSNFSFKTYVQVGNNVSIEDLNKKIENRIIEGNANSEQAKPFLRKYSDIFLYGIKGTGGNINQVYMFGIIAGIVLLIACINFMNISTARAGTRAREIGMRKVAGAHRKNIMWQFLGESTVLTIISFIFALILSFLFLPAFNSLSGKNLSLNILIQPFIIFGIIGIIIFTGLISGSYPAVFLASFRPVSMLKGTESSGKKSSFFRKVLVVLQFAISIVLIICTLVIYRQLNFVLNRDLGLEKNQVIYTVPRGEIGNNYSVFKQELLKYPDVLNITTTQAPVSYIGWNTTNWDWEGKEEITNPLVNFVFTDIDFINTFGIEMEDGVFFLKEHVTSANGGQDKIVINETFADIIGEGSPVGKSLVNGNQSYTIIGIVKDFNYQPLFRQIEPMAIFYFPSISNFIYMKINSQNIASTVENIGNIYNKFAADYPFEYRFLDKDFERLYGSVQQRGRLFRYFAFLAVFVSCLGLFGLASFTAEQRTKEIGIRKVLGSKISGIIILLNKEFLKWVAAANIIAWPVAFYFSNKLLSNYAFRINLGLDIFIISGLFAFVIAILTISSQSIKAASTNPVDSLRNE